LAGSFGQVGAGDPAGAGRAAGIHARTGTPEFAARLPNGRGSAGLRDSHLEHAIFSDATYLPVLQPAIHHANQLVIPMLFCKR
jgi:hypothetical protein